MIPLTGPTSTHGHAPWYQSSQNIEHISKQWHCNNDTIWKSILELQHKYCLQWAHQIWRPTNEPATLDSFNQKYFPQYCDFSNHVHIYQAHKYLCDNLRLYKQGINLDKDHHAFRNNQNKDDEDKNYGAESPSKPPHFCWTDPIVSSVKESLSHDLQALIFTM